MEAFEKGIKNSNVFFFFFYNKYIIYNKNYNIKNYFFPKDI